MAKERPFPSGLHGVVEVSVEVRSLQASLISFTQELTELVLGRCVTPPQMGFGSMKSFFLVLPLLAILGITLWWAVSAWNAVDVEMSIHGYIAMILGIVFSLVLGCGLMALMFYSSRHGYDDIDRR
jgi:hypothetical protein